MDIGRAGRGERPTPPAVYLRAKKGICMSKFDPAPHLSCLVSQQTSAVTSWCSCIGCEWSQ